MATKGKAKQQKIVIGLSALEIASEQFRKALCEYQDAWDSEQKASVVFHEAGRVRRHAEYLLSEARLAVLRAAAEETA